MWFILLDHSGSMEQPFKGRREFAGRTTESSARIKIEAAKEALLQHLPGLGTPDRIVLFEFTDTASVVFEGMSTDTAAVQKSLDGLEAGGGTDIANALRVAAAHARKGNVRRFRVLVISDGLSEEKPAADAAESLADAGAVIDVILIDPTDDGEAVARRIAVDGSVRAVVSAEELHAGVGHAATESGAWAKEAEEIQEQYERDVRRVAHAAPPEERLAFTSAYPGTVIPEQWYSLLVYLHLADLEAQVREWIDNRAAALRMEPSLFSQKVTSKLRRGTIIRFEPRAEGIEFNPPVQEVIWHEDIQEVSFRLRIKADEAGRFLPGVISVHAEGVTIASLPLSIRGRTPGEDLGEPELSVKSARTFERIFASYSTQDSAIVDACVAAYQALGIYVHIDKQGLRSSSGQRYWPILKRFIQDSDVFQLYWSKAAAGSPYVEQEWRYAYTLLSQKGNHFIHPLTWERGPLKPPPELGDRHFARLDLDTLFPGGAAPEAAVRTSAEPGVRPRAPVPTAVLPLLPSADPEAAALMRRDLSEVVHFLEDATGLRYYPVPTLLVDDYVVRAIRSRLTTDVASADVSSVELALSLAELLDRIAVDFHVQFRGKRSVMPQELSFMSAVGGGRLMSEKAFHAVRYVCEGAIYSTVEQWLLPYDLGLGGRFTALVPPHKADETFSGYLGRAIEQMLREANARNVTRVAALERLLPGLSLAATGYDRCTPGAAEERSMLGEDARGTVGRAMRLADELGAELELLHADMPFQFVLNAVEKPQWRDARDNLVGAGVPDFSSTMSRLEYFSQLLFTITRMLREGRQSLGDFEFTFGYSLSERSWAALTREFPDLGFQAQGSAASHARRPGASVTLRGRFSTLVDAFEFCSQHLLRLLRRFSTSDTLRQVMMDVPTYGIFVPGVAPEEDLDLRRWAVERGLSTELTLPRSPRVLFCINARERMEKRLRTALPEGLGGEEQVSTLGRCVLVHEHFHALAETALDAGGNAPQGPTFASEWRTASGLNEALAAWMELHFVRGQPDLEKCVLAYIRAGAYPAWPYAGAEVIEAFYQRGGIEEVRRLVTSLRADPKTAQAMFDVSAAPGAKP